MAHLHANYLIVDTPYQLPLIDKGPQERRISLSGDIVEPEIEHGIEQIADQSIAKDSGIVQVSGGLSVDDLGKCNWEFRIGEDQIAWSSCPQSNSGNPGRTVSGGRQPAEMLSNL